MTKVYLTRWVQERDGELGEALAVVDRIVDTGIFDQDEASLEVRLLDPGTVGSCGSHLAELVCVPHLAGPDDDRAETRLSYGSNEASMARAVRTLARRLAHLADLKADDFEARAEGAREAARVVRDRAVACSKAFDAAWPNDDGWAEEMPF